MKALKWWSLPVLLLALIAPNSRAQDPKQDSIKETLTQLAQKVKATTASLNPAQTSIRLGLFTGSGAALELGIGGGAFMSELSQILGPFVDPKATLELSGQVFLVEDPKEKGVKFIRLKARLTNNDGEDITEFKEFTAQIRKASDFAKIAGPGVAAFKSDADYSVPPSQGRLDDALAGLPPERGLPPKVKAFVKGSIVRSSEAGKYDVEILSSKNLQGDFKPLDVTLNGKIGETKFPGLPVVDIEKDTFYQVRVKNNDAVEIAVFLSIDGIDQFTFSENRGPDGRPEFRSWIVEPGKEVVIKGWHKNVKPGEVFSFLTTQAGKGAASKFPTLSQGNVGTIGVSIANTKPSGTKGPGLETTQGPPVKVDQKAVIRVIGEPHEFITIRYSH